MANNGPPLRIWKDCENEINKLLSSIEGYTPERTTYTDVFALVLRIAKGLAAVRVEQLRGTTVQVALVPGQCSLPAHRRSNVKTWVRLSHDGKSWILEEAWQSTKENAYIFLSVPAKRAIAASYVRNNLKLQLLG